jgi:glycosyltransferase involved in cell wall biosynthesis
LPLTEPRPKEAVSKPVVSVILPVYNVQPFVRAAIDSVLSQSFDSLELIVIDDGSTDGTAAEVERIGDERVMLACQDHRGVAATRNAAVKMARGRYIAFMDGDDVWLPGKLRADVDYLDSHPEADLIFSAMRVVDEAGRDLGRAIRRWDGVLRLRDLLIEDWIGTDTVVLRREAREQAGWFDETLPIGSDHDYWLRFALLRPANLHGSPRVSALYRRRSGQQTRDWKLQEQCWRRTFEKIHLICPNEVAEAEAHASANMYRALAATAYESGETACGGQLFRSAMSHAPGYLIKDRRTWFLGLAITSALLFPANIHRRAEGIARRWLVAHRSE